MATIFTNGVISLTNDLVFGVCVLDENGWVPLSELNSNGLKQVQRLLNHNPTCPADICQGVYGSST